MSLVLRRSPQTGTCIPPALSFRIPKCLIVQAALISRSCSVPQFAHTHSRTDNGNSVHSTSTSSTWRPSGSVRRDAYRPAPPYRRLWSGGYGARHPIAFARQRFFRVVLIFNVSMTIAWFSSTNRRGNVCRESPLQLGNAFMRRGDKASGLSRFDPFCLRERDFCLRCRFRWARVT
jgi:hypothetical protein